MMRSIYELAAYKEGRNIKTGTMEFPCASSAYRWAEEEADRRAWVHIRTFDGELFAGQDGIRSYGSLAYAPPTMNLRQDKEESHD